MKTAAGNQAGAMTGFLGMGMAMNAGGMNAQNLFAMGQQQQQQAQQAAPAPGGWTCACGASVNGNFCPNCGAKKPEPQPAAGAWKCSCGATASGKFCPECGSPTNGAKFCSNCGHKLV